MTEPRKACMLEEATANKFVRAAPPRVAAPSVNAADEGDVGFLREN
ncbi:MAG TPA: hypothetical protein VIV66_12510 [Pyrinomonadaceae bacterium]